MKDATTDAAAIDAWWKRWPDANIGLAMGRVSGLIAIDIDPRHDGERGLRLLDDEVGPLPATLWQRTPSGGRHLIFKLPEEEAVGCKVGIFPGIDIRGDGGYVVVAPSRTAAGAYDWADQREPTDAPDALIALLARPGPAGSRTIAPEYWARLAVEGATEGARNDTVARLAGYLVRHYVDPHLALSMMQAWNTAQCRPPLDSDEVARTVDSIAAKELRRRGVA